MQRLISRTLRHPGALRHTAVAQSRLFSYGARRRDPQPSLPPSAPGGTDWASTLFFGAPVAVTFSLGVWQLQRLSRKRKLIAARKRGLAQAPLSADELFDEGENDVEHRRVTLMGALLHPQTMLVGPRPAPKGLPASAGTTGYLVITPLHTPDCRTYLVHRGWVPSTLEDLTQSAGANEVGSELVTFTGVLRKTERRNRFVPENVPNMDLWFSIDVKEMFATRGVRDGGTETFIEWVEPVHESGWPHSRGLEEFMEVATSPETHVTYAVTWFLLSGCLAALSRGRARTAARRQQKGVQ